MAIEKKLSSYKAFKQAMDIVREYDKDDCAYIANLILKHKEGSPRPEETGLITGYYKPLTQGEV